jgi:hypothetical protein
MLAEMFIRTMQRYKKNIEIHKLFPKKFGDIFRVKNRKNHWILKGGDEGGE